MSRFIESICCIHGKVKNLELHQQRVNQVVNTHFNGHSIDLFERIKNVPEVGRYKLRVIYDHEIHNMEYVAYTPKTTGSIRLVDGGTIDYTYKYENRTDLDHLFEQRDDCDDILIIKNGLITDAYYSNVALFDGSNWYTPTFPLLNGIKRQFLLATGELKERKISQADIRDYEKISLINAMLDLGEIEVSSDNIHFN